MLCQVPAELALAAPGGDGTQQGGVLRGRAASAQRQGGDHPHQQPLLRRLPHPAERDHHRHHTDEDHSQRARKSGEQIGASLP